MENILNIFTDFLPGWATFGLNILGLSGIVSLFMPATLNRVAANLVGLFLHALLFKKLGATKAVKILSYFIRTIPDISEGFVKGLGGKRWKEK